MSISSKNSDYSYISKLFSFDKKKKKKKILKPGSTKEDKRGASFISKFKMLKILLEKKYEIYEKDLLAKLYFNEKKSTETTRRYVHRIMNLFEKMNLVYSCDELGNKIRKNQRYKKHWKICDDILDKLGLR